MTVTILDPKSATHTDLEAHLRTLSVMQVVIAVAVGVLLSAMPAARLFGRFHGGNSPTGS